MRPRTHGLKGRHMCRACKLGMLTHAQLLAGSWLTYPRRLHASMNRQTPQVVSLLRPQDLPQGETVTE
jgi:hypothetical protein